MLRVGFVEDQSATAHRLQGYLDRYGAENNIEMQVTRFSRAEELVYGYSNRFDLLLLDIQLGGMTGMEAAEQIRKQDSTVSIIFITSLSQYNDASLRRIVDAAGTTTGSVYMRYENKDKLFCSLTDCIVEETEKAFEELKPLYMSCGTLEDMMKATETESDMILRIIFEHYDAATLLLCKSEGSSAATFFEDLIRRKIQESESFFAYLPRSEDLLHALDVLLTVQFDMYCQILKNGYTETQAHNCMKIMMKFMNGGWNTVMRDFLKEKGEIHQ